MALTEVVSLEADVTYSLGKLNKKTGKKDPLSVEGYYLGNREVDTKLGKSLIHFFKTAKGNVGVWGSTDINRKMTGVALGNMTKVEFSGMKPTPRGEMRSFKVFQDKDNFIEIEVDTSAPSVDDEDETENVNSALTEDGNDDFINDDNDSDNNEIPLAASATTPAQRKQTVQDLLNRNKKK